MQTATNADYSPEPVEVQITHERYEWAYAVYVMGPGGCEYSQRFEYDPDIAGSKLHARHAAKLDYAKQKADRPGCNSYSDIEERSAP